MFAARRLAAAAPRAGQRSFSLSAPRFVRAGDAIPDLELVEGSPGNMVNLAKELKGKGVILGVPAAFSTRVGFCGVHLQARQLIDHSGRSLLLQFACTRLYWPSEVEGCWAGLRCQRQ